MVYNEEFKGNEKEILNFLSTNDLSCKINPMIKCGDASNLNEKSKNTYAEFLKDLFKEYIIMDKYLNIKPLTSMMRSVVNNMPLNECTFSKLCSKNFICIDYDGNIYPCGRFSDIKKYSYGNIDEMDNLIDDNLFNILLDRRDLNLPMDCVSCKYKNLCNGGCTMTALVDGEDIYSKTCFCNEYKELFEFMHKDALILIKDVLVERRKVLVKTMGE